MKIMLALFVSVLVLMPGNLQAFYSVAQMNTDALKKDASTKIRARKSGDEIMVIVALRRRAESPAVYCHGALDLVNPEGMLLARVEMRGEDMRRALDEETLLNWHWQDFGPAEVFRFTIAPKMLTKSRLWLETGPRNDEHGVPYGGGIIRWSYLQDVVGAAENAEETVEGTAARGSAHNANRRISVAEVDWVRLEVEQPSLSNEIQVRVRDSRAKALSRATVSCDLLYVDEAGRESKLEGVTLTNDQASDYAGTFTTAHRFTHGTVAKLVYKSPGLRSPISTLYTFTFH